MKKHSIRALILIAATVLALASCSGGGNKPAGTTDGSKTTTGAPGRPDVAFVGRKLAIFVMGCFWHRCPECQMAVPKKNVEYWEAKFARNVERDKRNLEALEAMGWKVLVLWEHQLKKKNLEEARRLLYQFVRRPEDPLEPPELPA